MLMATALSLRTMRHDQANKGSVNTSTSSQAAAKASTEPLQQDMNSSTHHTNKQYARNKIRPRKGQPSVEPQVAWL
jgi:hypothetical protein